MDGLPCQGPEPGSGKTGQVELFGPDGASGRAARTTGGRRPEGDSTAPQKLGQSNLLYSGRMYTIETPGLRALWQFVNIGRLPAARARRRR